jgi:hypothetical protein
MLWKRSSCVGGPPAGSIDDDERNKLRERYRWEVVGPNPL